MVSGIRKSKKNENISISPLAFIVYAVSKLLKDFPLLNSSLNESVDGYISKDYVNIGIAVDTERGLMVPNIKNTDKLSVQEISENINELAQKAKNKKIKPEDLKKGATFSISSLEILVVDFLPQLSIPLRLQSWAFLKPIKNHI